MIELSAGAGGSSLGAIEAGFDVHGIEINEDAVATHRLSAAGHHERQFPALVADDVARTIDTTNGLQQPGNHARQKPAMRLSVDQCARLQDFPPGFVFTGNKGSQHAQIGNAFPRSFAAAVFRQVARAILR